MLLQGSLYSQALDMETAVCFVAANDFTQQPPRKVAYLLHGLQGRADNFLSYTMLPDLCRKYHCLFVLPDAQRSFYADMAVGGRFFTYLTQELPQLIQDIFRVSTAREDSFLIGASMGGYGALKAAFTYPERYAACAAVSPACLDMRRYMTPQWRDGSQPDAFRRIFGDKLATDFDAAFGPGSQWSAENDVLALAERAAKSPHRPRIFTCWGDGDVFRDTNRAFPGQMAALGWPVCAREIARQSHCWAFFNEALALALPFCLEEKEPPAGVLREALTASQVV